MRWVIIDTDTASDDAVATMLAFNRQTLSIDAITTVVGNVSLSQASANARFTADLCNAIVAVYEGAAII